MNRIKLLTVAVAGLLQFNATAQGLSTGEYSYQVDGSPAMTGQATHDHLFTQCEYNGQAYINKVSFEDGSPQTVWFYLNDDEIYLNEAIQALTPIAYNAAGDLYNEITYNSFQCNIYLPENIQIISIFDDDFNEIYYVQGDRLPSTSSISWSEKSAVTIDGKTYRAYTLTCYNTNAFGSHLSAKNATLYKRNGALKKEYSLFGLYLQNDNQNVDEGRLGQDLIIANQLFTLRETFIAQWDSNDAVFFYGTGGNNESQRFMTYNRVELYGSNGIASINGDVNGDGIISIDDVTELIDLLLSGEQGTGNADANNDGVISIDDVTELIDLLLRG